MIALQPARDHTDDTGVPAFATGDQDRWDHGAVFQRGSLGLLHHLGLDCAAFKVEVVEPLGQFLGALGVVGGEQVGTDPAFTHARAGIDARSEVEAENLRGQCAVAPRDLAQRLHARVGPALEDLQALADVDAIEAEQGNHVAHRAHGHHVQHAHQVRRGNAAVLVEIHLPQRAVERDQKQEGQPTGRDDAVLARVVEAIGVHHGDGRGQDFRRHMVVEHDDFGSGGVGSLDRVVGHDPAIEGDDQVGAVERELAHALDLGAVAFLVAVGDIAAHFLPQRAEEPADEGGAGGAVNVEIGEQRDRLFSQYRRYCAFDRGIHIEQVRRVGQDVAQAGFKKVLHPLGVDRPRGQRPRDRGRQTGAGCNLAGDLIAGFAGDPAVAGNRAVHAQKGILGAEAGRGQRAAFNRVGIRHRRNGEGRVLVHQGLFLVPVLEVAPVVSAFSYASEPAPLQQIMRLMHPQKKPRSENRGSSRFGRKQRL
ncbi:MAG: Uncharacterised protein [Rhodospirillaceae bacterium]|nr:MAG: Uncharacterised protein [Rhodospirillaceae bacterium]